MEKLNEVMGLILMTDGAALKDEDTPDTVENWDSVTHVVLLTSVEDEFGVRFTDEEMENISTVGEIRKAVAEKANA